MEVHVIKTEQDYNKALKEIDKLLDAEEGSKEEERLELLSILVEDYEDKHYKIDDPDPDPVAAIEFMMDQLGLTKKDLQSLMGSKVKVSEILSRKRSLTLPMIRKLHKKLNIPADILIQENKKPAA